MPFGAKHGPWRVPVYFTACLALLLVLGLDSFSQTNSAAEAAGKAAHAIEEGRLSEAEALLEEAVQAEPSNANYAYALGNVYLLSGKPKPAIPVLQKCLRLTPGDWDARIALAQAYQKVDADADAIRLWAPSHRRGAAPRFGDLRVRSVFIVLGIWPAPHPNSSSYCKTRTCGPLPIFSSPTVTQK